MSNYNFFLFSQLYTTVKGSSSLPYDELYKVIKNDFDKFNKQDNNYDLSLYDAMLKYLDTKGE